MQTPLISNKKRKAAEALQKSEFEMPVAPSGNKRAKQQAVEMVAATPLRD